MKILQKLEQIEKENGVKILLACESGSKAWGFSSKDSDFDIRFIYVHEISFYLSIERKYEQIEIKEDKYDFVGWDLKKALHLLRKSNPSIFEWINSPIVYLKDDEFFKELKKLSEISFNPKTLMYHYLGMAKQNSKYVLQKNVEIKKYLYILKSLFSLEWLEKNKTVPPVEFDKLYSSVDLNPKIKKVVDLILKKKRKVYEKETISKSEILDDFIFEKINYYKNFLKNYDFKKNLLDVSKFDNFFQKTLLRFDKQFCSKIKEGGLLWTI